jgi:hypothetical protein
MVARGIVGGSQVTAVGESRPYDYLRDVLTRQRVSQENWAKIH